jgi:hypothetical protein
LSDVVDPELEELLREIDGLVAQRDWDGLMALRDRARASHERGKQHWPAASHAEYRLALEAPGPYAGAVLLEGAGRFALGPLTEVAASTHRWEELDGHVPGGPLRTIAIHECILRADLTAYDKGDPGVLPVALSLQSWEPLYPVATYRPDEADFPMPPLPAPEAVDLPPEPPEASPDVDEAIALRGLAATWVSESNGSARSVGVRGRADTAISALGVTRARVARLSPADAMALMAWTAASGGAEGRRRGMAWGRFLAWECAAILAGVEIDEVGDVIDDLRWYAWDEFAPSVGWSLRIAVEDPDNDVAWAVEATDQASTLSR